MNKDQLISQIETDFNKQFAIKPKLLTLTPGRINIIGEHTDYNEGLAMPVAIDRWICAAVSNNDDKLFNIHFEQVFILDNPGRYWILNIPISVSVGYRF